MTDEPRGFVRCDASRVRSGACIKGVLLWRLRSRLLV
jgi:hypothetical protein